MAVFTVGLNPAVDRILECDALRPGSHQKMRLVARLAAGKAANVSRALAQLGVDTTATGFVGRREAGFFGEELAAPGPGKITCRFIEIDQPTRENVTILETIGGGETHLRETGFTVDSTAWASLENFLGTAPARGDLVVIAGSLPAGVATADFLSLIDALLARGVQVAVDVAGPALAGAMTRAIWAVKPNADEISSAGGRSGAWAQGLRDDPMAIVDLVRQVAPRVENALVSRGAAGAVLIRSGGAWTGWVKNPGRIVRTVGCGDYLLAGFIAGKMRNFPPPDALAYALAVATARAVSDDFSAIRPAEIQRIQPQVQIAGF